MPYSVEWTGTRVRLLDQRLLPQEERYVELSASNEVAEAIRTMGVRGAPAIGVAAAYGVVLAAHQGRQSEQSRLAREAIVALAATRPTAVNLFAALERMHGVLESTGADVAAALLAEAQRIHREEIESSATISRLCASLFPEAATVLTHCNAGPIATAGHGTALGAIIEGHHQGKVRCAIATETRPLLQGARLTVWELVRAGVQTTLITDSMVGHIMRTEGIDCVVVGADRIAANGDVANKIGTYGIALLARAHRVPFYVAAPCSTIDFSLRNGNEISIEEREASEVTALAGVRIAAEGCSVRNPAFDVTPHRLISAIVTERGILSAPYATAMKNLAGNTGGRRQ